VVPPNLSHRVGADRSTIFPSDVGRRRRLAFRAKTIGGRFNHSEAEISVPYDWSGVKSSGVKSF